MLPRGQSRWSPHLSAEQCSGDLWTLTVTLPVLLAKTVFLEQRTGRPVALFKPPLSWSPFFSLPPGGYMPEYSVLALGNIGQRALASGLWCSNSFLEA